MNNNNRGKEDRGKKKGDRRRTSKRHHSSTSSSSASKNSSAAKAKSSPFDFKHFQSFLQGFSSTAAAKFTNSLGSTSNDQNANVGEGAPLT